MPIFARFAIVDACPVADVQRVRGAVAPDRVLHEARKVLRESLVESRSVDLHRGSPDYIGAAAWRVAQCAVSVRKAAFLENACPVQEIMDQRIDRDHCDPSVEPARAFIRHSDEKAGERHREDLVGYAVYRP